MSVVNATRQPSLFDAAPSAPAAPPPPVPPAARQDVRLPPWRRQRPAVYLIFTGESWPAMRQADRAWTRLRASSVSSGDIARRMRPTWPSRGHGRAQSASCIIPNARVRRTSCAKTCAIAGIRQTFWRHAVAGAASAVQKCLPMRHAVPHCRHVMPTFRSPVPSPRRGGTGYEAFSRVVSTVARHGVAEKWPLW